MLYTPIRELDKTFLTLDTIDQFNSLLVGKTMGSHIGVYDGYAYIKSYEDNTIAILKKLIDMSSSGDDEYAALASNYISSILEKEIDEEKIEILKTAFSSSSVLLINGAAGTGKTTLIKHFSNIFKKDNVLFLSSTNSSVQNLRIKVGKMSGRGRNDFMTLEKYQSRFDSVKFSKYSILVVDECSMVENELFNNVLASKSFSKILLVGDERQIESIRFGNWFGIACTIINNVHELTYNHRTNDGNLKVIWDMVRTLDNIDTIHERIISAGYHSSLSNELFIPFDKDEVILCLNYDGLYGINNINKYLQETNNGKQVSWKVWTFKVHDRILFNESYYFRDYFYNNQKGIIEDIVDSDTVVAFEISVEHEETNSRDCLQYISWIKEENNRDYYRIVINKEDDDDEESGAQRVLVVPFQLGYAISIHKSQGLEFESVKIVLTREVEEQISHNVFYTAITRAKKHLRIYCDKESLSHVIGRFEKQEYDNDTRIIARKYLLKFK